MESKAKRERRYQAERDLLVAVLTTIWPAHLAEPAQATLAADTIVCVHSPMGQLAWAVHSDRAALFAHLAIDQSCVWDGHSASQRMARLRSVLDDYAKSR